MKPRQLVGKTNRVRTVTWNVETVGVKNKELIVLLTKRKMNILLYSYDRTIMKCTYVSVYYVIVMMLEEGRIYKGTIIIT